MKLAMVNTWGGGAIYNVFRPLYEALKARGWDVTWFQIRDGEPDLRGFDLAHYNYFRNMPPSRHLLSCPFTATVHHLHPQHVQGEMVRLVNNPVAVHTADPFCRRQLQQHGYANVHVIPYTFDWSPFPLLPLPEEFTVGYLGCDYNTKRFDMIERAAAIAGVPCKGIGRKTLNEEENFIPQAAITDFYRSISCYVVASYNDGGPLPPQEALLCGRPVATTHVGMMDLIVSERKTGYFHDGSPRGVAEAILKVKVGIEHMREDIEEARAIDCLLPSTASIVGEWETFFHDALERSRS